MFEESEAARPWLQRFLISRNARLILLSNQIVVPPGTRSPMRCIKFSAVTVLSSSASTVFPNQSKRFEEVMLVNRVPAEWLKIYLEKTKRSCRSRNSLLQTHGPSFRMGGRSLRSRMRAADRPNTFEACASSGSRRPCSFQRTGPAGGEAVAHALAGGGWRAASVIIRLEEMYVELDKYSIST